MSDDYSKDCLKKKRISSSRLADTSRCFKDASDAVIKMFDSHLSGAQKPSFSIDKLVNGMNSDFALEEVIRGVFIVWNPTQSIDCRSAKPTRPASRMP